MRVATPLILGVLFAAACAAELETTSDGEPIRGPLGKADAVGSCGEVCDGPAPVGNCWCDEDCLAYGDCCDDRADFCPAPAEQACGGPQDLPCGAGEYCHYEAEAGDSACGPVGELGTCVPKPEVCLEVHDPVCGCDGETYGNACDAHQAGINVATHRACDQADEV